MEGKQFNIRTLIIASLLALLLVGFNLVVYNLQILKGDEYLIYAEGQDSKKAAEGLAAFVEKL